MTDETPSERPEDTAKRGQPVGLRVRLWLACLASALVTGAGAWWLTSDPSVLGTPIDPTRLTWALFSLAAASAIAGLVLLLWLDRGIIRHLRGVLRGMRSGRVADLRGLPSSGGWGELSELTEQAQVLLAYQRQALRAAEELGALRKQLARVHEATARWAVTERFTRLEAEQGALAPLAESLNQSVRRLEELDEQHYEVALQVRDELTRARDDTRNGGEQAERTFVEATSLLTTVRELHRLTQELDAQLVATPPDGEGASEVEAWRESCRLAINDLVGASAESVEDLARGLMSVQDVADQVQVLGNRATMVALNVALAALRAPDAATEVSELPAELKSLVADVRSASDRMVVLIAGVNRDVQDAAVRMDGVREKVAERLNAAPRAPRANRETATRVLERMREMVQDAGSKGERLVSSAERTSRAAERAARALEESMSELDGLVVRLRASTEPADPRILTSEAPVEGESASGASGGAILRLLEPDAGELEPPDASPRGGEGL